MSRNSLRYMHNVCRVISFTVIQYSLLSLGTGAILCEIHIIVPWTNVSHILMLLKFTNRKSLNAENNTFDYIYAFVRALEGSIILICQIEIY